jgi:hypothetical protein
MGITNNNLCDSCANIGCMFQSGIVRTECAFYMPPHIEPDNCGNYVIMQPIVKAIPKAEVKKFLEEGTKNVSNNVLAIVREDYIHKADYENRLKADMVAMLTEIQIEIEEKASAEGDWIFAEGERVGVKLIQQKIDSLKGENKK